MLGRLYDHIFDAVATTAELVTEMGSITVMPCAARHAMDVCDNHSVYWQAVAPNLASAVTDEIPKAAPRTVALSPDVGALKRPAGKKSVLRILCASNESASEELLAWRPDVMTKERVRPAAGEAFATMAVLESQNVPELADTPRRSDDE